MTSASETGPEMRNKSAFLKPESQGVTTNPAEQILGSCKGVLHDKVQFWMAEFPEQLEDFNLLTFEDMQNNTEIDVAATAAIIFEDVNDKILKKGKNRENQKHCLSKMQAQTLAGIIKNTAKRCGGYSSPPRGDATGGAPSSASGKTESQMSREATQMAMYANVKHEIKLPMPNGDSQPSNVYDVMAFIEGVSKVLMGFEGYPILQQIIMERKGDPGFSMGEVLSSYNLPPDLDKQYAKQLCNGTTARYRSNVVDKSQYGDSIYVSGLQFSAALLDTATDLDDLYCSEKRTAYLKAHPIRPNDKRALAAGISKYVRDSFELYHLQDLGSARTSPELTQYRVGATLLTNYHDLSRKWSKMWDESERQDMSRLRDMIIAIENEMRHLPVGARHAAVLAPPGAPTANGTTPVAPTSGREICRNFRHKGHCRFGANCKFDHEVDKPMVMLSQVCEAHIGELQQMLMDNMPEAERALTHMSPELCSIYEEGLATVGRPEHKETMRDMQQVFLTVLSDDPQVSMNVQPAYDPVGSWSLDYVP